MVESAFLNVCLKKSPVSKFPSERMSEKVVKNRFAFPDKIR